MSAEIIRCAIFSALAVSPALYVGCKEPEAPAPLPPPAEAARPDGGIAAQLPLARVLGCVVHASTFTPEPGLVEQRMGQGLIIGEPAGGGSARAQRLAELLRAAGFDTTLSSDIRQDVWYKLWGNMTMNPLTAITGLILLDGIGEVEFGVPLHHLLGIIRA